MFLLNTWYMSGVGKVLTDIKMYLRECSHIDWKTASVCIVALTIVIAGAYYWFVIRKRQLESFEYNINREPSDSSGSAKTAELMFFFAEWCPHCVKAKPEWKAVRDEYEGKTVNGYVVKFKEVDCTSETDESEKMVDKYKVEGYPTVKLIKDVSVIDFDAKVSKDNLIEFLNTML